MTQQNTFFCLISIHKLIHWFDFHALIALCKAYVCWQNLHYLTCEIVKSHVKWLNQGQIQVSWYQSKLQYITVFHDCSL